MRVGLTLFVLLVASVGCRGVDPRSDFRSPCEEHAECRASGICLFAETGDRSCTIRCTTDADCGTWTCGVREAGERACLPPCDGTRPILCVGGISHTCAALADESLCETCGCNSDPMRPRCDPGVGCTTRSDLGGACLEDDDCRTGNCSRYDRVCRVPLGQPCSGGADCDRCLVDPDTGWSFCSRTCDRADACQSGECIGPRSGDDYTCRPPCAGCPGSCATADGVGFCACDGCTIIEARAPGFPCATHTECGAGWCWSSGGEPGTCTRECGSDADCGRLARCVDIPCADGQTSDCGAMCAATCNPLLACGCVELQGSGGLPISVCDMRGSDGASCVVDGECRSLRCDAGRCIPLSGLPNGWPCELAESCASAICVSGVCRGPQLLGDACMASEDCQVGICCGVGASAGTCQNTCR